MLRKITALFLLLTLCLSLVACGDPGPKGDKGDKGDSLTLISFEKIKTEGLSDTYKMTFSDGSTSEFTVTNGKNGENGENGLTPTIGQNGNWWIGDIDTGVKLTGADGKNGLTPTIGENGNWYLGETDTGIKAQGENGENGENGLTPTIGQNGNWWIGNVDTQVKALGTQGPKGDDGITPTIGINGNWYLGETDTGVKAEGTNGLTPAIGENGNWWIGTMDTGIYAGNASSASFSKVELEASTSINKTYKITYSDNSTSSFDICVDGADKSQVVTAYEAAVSFGYAGTIDEWIADITNKTFSKFVFKGSLTDAKTLGAAIGKILADFDKYYTVTEETNVVSTTPLDGAGNVLWSNTPQTLGDKPQDKQFYFNTDPIAVEEGQRMRILAANGSAAYIRILEWFDESGTYLGRTYLRSADGYELEELPTSYAPVDGAATYRLGVDYNHYHGASFQVYTVSAVINIKPALDVGAINQIVNGTSTGGGNMPDADKVVSAVIGSPMIEAKKDTVAMGNFFNLTENTNTIIFNKVLSFKCTLSAPLESGKSFFVGHGWNEFGGNFIEITSTQIKVYGDTTAASRVPYKTEDHGLTLDGYINLTIDNSTPGKAVITLSSASGMFQLKDVSWKGRKGRIFAYSETMDLENVTLRWRSAAYGEKIWIYGDSYFDVTYGARWPYYLVQNGYTNYLLSSYAGMSTAACLEQFKFDLERGTPKYAVWCCGMNDSDTDKETVSASYLAATQEFLEICADKGITPVLATIPSVPNRSHYAKNEWIRSTNIRIVDFSAAVGGDRYDATLIDGTTNTTGAYWYDAMLHSDNVHTDTKGAMAIYAQFITDFPEILEKD